jgi:pimeloyl-ACP methyl ester carboxylesterase
MPLVELNGTPVAYEDTGPPTGNPTAPAILFGHGLLFSGWMFSGQISDLAGRYRCVTIDWRGQGDTPPARSGGYDMDTLTHDAITLIEHLDIAPVHYVGLSMGGFVGQRIAARRGELLRSLTLLDTSPDREPPWSAIKDIAMATVYRYFGVRLLQAPVEKIMFGPTFRRDPASRPIIDEFIDRVQRADRKGLRGAILAVATRKPIYAELASVRVPTQVITGADDVPTPVAKGRRIAGAIEDAKFAVVPDSGHSSTVEQPDAVTALIRAFVQTVDNG